MTSTWAICFPSKLWWPMTINFFLIRTLIYLRGNWIAGSRCSPMAPCPYRGWTFRTVDSTCARHPIHSAQTTFMSPCPWFPSPRIMERDILEVTVHSEAQSSWSAELMGGPALQFPGFLQTRLWSLNHLEGKRQALVTSDGTLVIHNLSIYDRGFL